MVRRHLFLLSALALCPAVPSATPQLTEAQQSREEERLERLNFQAILRALAVQEGHHIADLGAGGGAFTFALARAVGPRGVVYAVEIDEDAIERLRRRATESNAGNVEVIHGDVDNPKLPAGSLDGVLLVDTYH